MKKLLVPIVLLGGLLMGCTSGETAMEHNRRLRLQSDLQWRMFVDDCDEAMLLNYPSRLNRWSTRIGY